MPHNFLSESILEFKIVKKLGVHTFGHSVFAVRKIFNKVFTTLFSILYLASVNRLDPTRPWPQ